MAEKPFDEYLRQINEAYLRGDATEHTHRPALKKLIESLGKKLTATNEPRRVKCGAPDFVVTRRKRTLDEKIGYIECKDIGTNLSQAAKTEQIKKRYLPGLHNFVLTDYIEFRWYVSGEVRLAARLANEGIGEKFKLADKGVDKVGELLGLFLSQEAERITTAKELAIRMGGMARLMRNVIGETFKQEEEAGILHGQLEAFREVLIHDLKPERFADMYAQTICYGLFTGRCHIEDMTVFGPDKYAAFHGMNGKRGEFTRRDAAYLLPKTNPFLRKMFNHIAGPDLDERIAWLVDDVVALLRETRMEGVLKDFARKKGRRDPVVHFYETFLAEYDPKLRKSRGVYYTPDPVVSYIVRSVDWLLKENFGVKRGLADESKIKTEKGEVHKVLILDPAVGTGTFLFEVIDLIHSRFRKQKGMWSGYVREHLLPRLFGFELMMAPYAIAHMKLGLELAETGYDFESDERLGIYLTNTLEEAEETTRNLFAQWLSEEARAANNVKKDLPIMVVLGNPPYSNFGMMNQGEWILGLLEDYKKGLGEKKLNIRDDFIKFIRYGQFRIDQTGAGVLAFITNNTYIDGITRRRMRESLLETFSDIYILNLHGDIANKEKCPDGSKDENIFDIQQGVAIGIFVREWGHKGLGKVHYLDKHGLRKEKYEWLVKNSTSSTDWKKLLDINRDSSLGKFYFFAPKQFSSIEEYCEGMAVNSIFPLNGSGVKTDRDGLFFDHNKDDLVGRIKEFYSETGVTEPFKTQFNVKNSSSYDILTKRKDSEFSQENISRCTYRPFDDVYCYYSPAITSRAAWDIMQHVKGRKNVSLLGMRQYDYDVPDYCYSFVSGKITECRVFVSKRGVATVSPLYLYPTEGKKEVLFDDSEDGVWEPAKGGRVPNLSREFVEELGKRIKLEFVSDGRGDLKETFGPEDVFDYIYGVLHSPEYRRRYAEFLKIDFPRVPWPKGRVIFRKICKVGRELVKLHLTEHEILEENELWPEFNISGINIVEKGYPKYVAHADRPDKGKVYINKDQYFEGVRADVWEFHIGGYQVCEKWLKDRRGRELSYEDIRHYQKIVVALGESIRLMKQPCLVEMFEGKK